MASYFRSLVGGPFAGGGAMETDKDSAGSSSIPGLTLVGSEQSQNTYPSPPNLGGHHDQEITNLAEYLARPEVQQVLLKQQKKDGSANGPGPGPQGGGGAAHHHHQHQSSEAAAAIIDQSSNSQSIALLNHLSQTRGLSLNYEFASTNLQLPAAGNGFGVRLRVGDVLDVVEAGPYRTKKKAKEVVAEKALALLKEKEATSAALDVRTGDGDKASKENWVGKLQEHYQTKGVSKFPALVSPGPRYTSLSVGGKFAYEVEIDARPAQPFGGRSVTFPSLKAAKSNAAREACEWLEREGLMAVRGPGGGMQTVGGEVSAGCGGGGESSSSSGVGGGRVASSITIENGDTGILKRDASAAQKVNDLCHILHVSPPHYSLTTHPNSPSILSGSASFPNDPLLKSPVGEVRNIYGKKNAKDECAALVLAYLREVARGRGMVIRDE
ncbi:MAG: hypothetical protein M1837_000558 [Sclerophora amabilis]|nr:MAG: hypothetical protein M1837_000558 [Sclerophora amabilis]